MKKDFDGVLEELLIKIEPFDNSKRIAYIDSCAGDHVWRLDSSKYLRNVNKQYGRSVIGITGDKKPLDYIGTHRVLDKVNLGDVTTNLISLPKILDNDGTIYGNKSGCMIWNKDGKLIIMGKRGNKGMYCCEIGNMNKDIEVMESIIDNDGIVYDKHLSGEEVERAKHARDLHNRMHINERVLGIGLDNGCYKNNVNLTSVDVENSIRLFGKCRACVEGLIKAPVKKKSNSEPAREIGFRIAMDLIPLSETSLGGNNWGMIGTDEKCGYVFLCGMKKKDIECVEDGIWSIVIEVRSYGHEVKEILFDN